MTARIAGFEGLRRAAEVAEDALSRTWVRILLFIIVFLVAFLAGTPVAHAGSPEGHARPHVARGRERAATVRESPRPRRATVPGAVATAPPRGC